jgi:hypothetical protein
VNLDFLIGSSLSSEPFFHVSIGPKIAEQVKRADSFTQGKKNGGAAVKVFIVWLKVLSYVCITVAFLAILQLLPVAWTPTWLLELGRYLRN